VHGAAEDAAWQRQLLQPNVDNERHHASPGCRPFACKSVLILTSRSRARGGGGRIIHNFKIVVWVAVIAGGESFAHAIRGEGQYRRQTWGIRAP